MATCSCSISFFRCRSAIASERSFTSDSNRFACLSALSYLVLASDSTCRRSVDPRAAAAAFLASSCWLCTNLHK